MSDNKKTGLESLVAPCHLLIVGATMSGKTFLARKLIDKLRRSDTVVIVITGTPISNQYDSIASTMKSGKKSEKMIYSASVMNTVNKDKVFVGAQKIIDYCSSTKHSKIIVMDDFIGTINLKKNPLGAFTPVARHHNTSMVFISQKLTESVPVLIRENVHHLFLLAGLSEKSLHSAWEEYCSRICDYERFCLEFDSMPQYNALWIDKSKIPTILRIVS